MKTAGAVSLSALTAWMCCHEGLAPMANMKNENSETRPAQEHHKRPREHEPGPMETSTNDYATHCSLTGSSAVTPRLCALGGHAMAGGDPQGPWNSAEFQGMPTGNSDRWRSLVGGWYCRVHGGLRSRLFHPVHTSTPVRPEDLEAERVTVIWHCPGGRPWTRMIHQDDPPGFLGSWWPTHSWYGPMEGIHLFPGARRGSSRRQQLRSPSNPT